MIKAKTSWNFENVWGMLTDTTQKDYWCSRNKGVKDFPRYSSEAFIQEKGFYIRPTSLFVLGPLRCHQHAFSRQVNLLTIKGLKSLTTVAVSHSRQNQENLQNSKPQFFTVWHSTKQCHLPLNSISSFSSFWWSEDTYFCSAAGNFNTFPVTTESSCHELIIE